MLDIQILIEFWGRFVRTITSCIFNEIIVLAQSSKLNLLQYYGPVDFPATILHLLSLQWQIYNIF